MKTITPRSLQALSLAVALSSLSACGGGSSSSTASEPPPSGGLTIAQRADAATKTAQGQALCSTATMGTSYYWEIGDKDGALASGSVGTPTVTAATSMKIASASKWLYAAYVVEKSGGVLNSTTDIPYLNFTSGYSDANSQLCGVLGSTVQACLQTSTTQTLNATEKANASFHYNSGHMQHHADAFGLGAKTADTLATEVSALLGASIGYWQPQLAGGAQASAADYRVFLRKMLQGAASPLRIASKLGDNPVCTLKSASCPNADAASVVPEAWFYGLGHWIEYDAASSTPAAVDAYSSGGTFGFYPWVDGARNWYGMVARFDTSGKTDDGVGQGYVSGQCGRKIRNAWLTGVPQL